MRNFPGRIKFDGGPHAPRGPRVEDPCFKLYLVEQIQWYGHVNRMPEQRLPKLIMEWIQIERKKKGRPKKTWMEGVQEAMTIRGLEAVQWMVREGWRLVSGRQRKMS